MSTINSDYPQDPLPTTVVDPSPSPSLDPPSPSPLPLTATRTNTSNTNLVEDVVFWRKKKASASVMTAATTTWVLLQIYQFNFLTIASWISMAIVVSFFLWGNLMRLVDKQAPKVFELEAVSEQTAVDAAETVRELVEEAVRWMLKLGGESEWYEFAGVVGGLLVFSWISSRVEFITLIYTGVMVGLTAPLVYVKYEDRVRGYWEHIKVQGHKWCKALDDKVVARMKHKVGSVENKEKKME